jgi:predicted nucleic acid-binding protein
MEFKADIYYSDTMYAEYSGVLVRPKIQLNPVKVKELLILIKSFGHLIAPPPLPGEFADPKDRPFWEAAVHADALLITGNTKHFPDDPRVVTPAAFVLGGVGAPTPPHYNTTK